MSNGMNRPGTIINWKDITESTNVIEEVAVRPLYFQLFTSDKGPEGLRTVYGNEFFKLYGSTPSFKNHGQPLIQAAGIIKAGGELLCKRVVADDATLANLVIVANVTKTEVQKTNTAGALLYIDADTGKETTDDNGGLNKAATINTATVKYEAVSVKGAKTIREVKAYAQTLLKDELIGVDVESYNNLTRVGDPLTDENPVGDIELLDGGTTTESYVYPLFVVTDNGRGASFKRFNITPDYTISKALDFQLYKLNFIGDTTSENEYVWFNFRDDIIYLNKNRSLDMIGKDLVQIQASSFDDSISLYVQRLADITGVSEDELNNVDVIFGCNRKGENLSYMTIDNEGYILNSTLGMMLQEGDNGSFGDAPIDADSDPANIEYQDAEKTIPKKDKDGNTIPTLPYTNAFVNVINGDYDDSIFDKDRFMVDVCCDANYPIAVKNALYDLAVFREDFVYLRDYGTDATTFESVKQMQLYLPKSKFVADYCQSWDIMDPWTKKQIPVTATYNMALALVTHLVDKRSYPICGILHGFTFPDVIEGTVSYLPKVTPSVDQKTDTSDLNINYASYINGTLTMETCYTSQETRNQHGYINNILAVTGVIHNIKSECPRMRYSFITDTDLDKYREEVNKVIQRSVNDFDTIYMEYTQDEIMAANKIFEADIFVKFKNFEQEEIFNIYTLS